MKKTVCKEITLERGHFITNTLGENEFEWYLRELGVSDEDIDDIQSITITVDSFDY